MRPVRNGDPDRIGDYAVEGRLGHGAMGTVYLGRSPGGRRVAVKVTRPELADDPGFRERFRQEVATARAVGGFWTAAVVDADPDAAQPWLATEYVPGPTLRDNVTAHGPLPEAELRRLLAGLAEALAAIHGAGLVHRDLKPSNVLLAADGPRVIDFGIAKALEGAGLTSTGVVVGTPGFLSPEQVETGTVTPASDVFALGSVLVYAATGRGPFGTGEVAALLYRAVHGQPDLDGVPADLRPLVARCLDPRPESRPTPAELLAETGRADAVESALTVATLARPRRTDRGRDAARQYTLVAAAPPLPAPPGGNRAVFATSRASAAVWGALAAAAAFVCGAVAGAASDSGDRGAAALFFAGFAVLVIQTMRYLWVLACPGRWVEVSRDGLTVGTGPHRRRLDWAQLARVRVVEDLRRPWLVVWLADPHVQDRLGAEYRRDHGGFRVFPIGHERRRRARDREVRELRAALCWYGRSTYDPSP